MAETPEVELTFQAGCPDCGTRQARLPAPLPKVGDDFDWRLRDYDGFRLFMLEELAARFPERRRWTAADLEVVLVEVLAAVLDTLSDMLDRVAHEAYLATARRPESVRRLLSMIAYDAVRLAQVRGEIDPTLEGEAARQALLRHWLNQPSAMERARAEGPRRLFTQRRMVTLDDYAERLAEHPLVRRAHAQRTWSGAWDTLQVAVILAGGIALDETDAGYPLPLREAVDRFHGERGLCPVDWGAPPTPRALLRPYLDAYRMAGQEVLLQDARPVGIVMALSLRVAREYYQSEVRQEVRQALGTGPGGFFEPGRLRFGEDLYASDLIETIMRLEGVEHVCLNRFKRIGRQYPDRADSGHIPLDGLEIAVCDDDPRRPERGYYRLTLHGGRRG